MLEDFSDVLERLGLAQYLQVFTGEGFDSWDTLMDITESDLQELGVKLGHRRVCFVVDSGTCFFKLQRAIINSRGRTKDNVAIGPSPHLGQSEDLQRSDGEGSSTPRERKKMSGVNSAGNPVGQKRKYRRHPKADEFAPERPPSAYVIFSNQMRDKLKGQDLSFTEIAKIVGEHWQELSPQEKEPCERQAQALKEKYYAELNEYKKTPRYTEYQEYLAEFKARDNSKKPKSEAETVGSTRSNSQDRGDKHSELQHDVSRMRIAQSPTTLGKSDNKIAWIGSMSPGSQARRYSVASHRGEDELDKAFFPHVSGFRPLSSEAPTEDGLWASASSKRQGRPLHLLSGPTHSSSNSTDGIAHNANASPSPSMMYQNLTSGDNQVYPPRRVTTTTNTLPSPIPALTRNGTTKSSISESSVSSSSWSTNSLSAINETNVQSHRVLPPPTPSAAPTDGASRSKAQSSKPSNPGSSLSELSSLDSRTKSSLATLLRAGEQLDRDAEQKIPISNITRPRDRPWES